MQPGAPSESPSWVTSQNASRFLCAVHCHFVTRAEVLKVHTFHSQVGLGELQIPAIRGVGGSLLYFLEAAGKNWDTDFEALRSDAASDRLISVDLHRYFAAVADMRARGADFLKDSGQYYDDIEAKFDLDAATMATLRDVEPAPLQVEQQIAPVHCGPIQRSSSPAVACRTPAGICVPNRRCRGWRIRRDCAT